MSQTCGICRHSRREEIERAMLGNISCRKIAGLYQTSPSCVSRHRQHIPASLLGAARSRANQEDSELAKATDKLLAEVRGMQRRLRLSRKRNTVEVADLLLKISREIRALLELRSRIAGPRANAMQRPGPSTQEPTESDAAEITEAEADEIAKKWLARRGSALDHNANVPLKSLAAQGVSAHCPDKSANEFRLEDSK
jgi:hypothetical protein